MNRALNEPWESPAPAGPDDPSRRNAPPGVVEENIRTLVEHRRRIAATRSTHNKIADAIGGFAGSLAFVLLHLLGVVAWVVINLGLTPWPPFDPTFVLLATCASVEAIFLSAFVLMTQNRMARDADRHAQLDLQISLLTEHELTRVLRVLTSLAAHLDVKEAHDPSNAELAAEVDPTAVLDAIERESDDQKT